MSDAADLSLPISSRHGSLTAAAHTFDSAFPTQAINDSHAFPYSTRRWLSGVRRSLAALASGGVGAALLLQIPHTPALSIQVAILGTLLTLGGVVWGVQAIQDFLGQLVIDGSGVHQLPAFGGFSIAWDDLHRWEVREDLPETLAIPSIRFWGADRPTSYSVPNRQLSDADRHAIRRLLQLRAPCREMSSAKM